jgi:hypothetical protein
MVEEFISQKGVAFEEIDVSRDYAAAQELVSKTGQRGDSYGQHLKNVYLAHGAPS